VARDCIAHRIGAASASVARRFFGPEGGAAVDEQEQWQLDGTAPELYQRYLVPAITALWAADLVARAALRAGERVLDVACGTGVVARAVAEQVGQTGRVTALDNNPGMLAVARALPQASTTIEWLEGSVLALPFPDAAFDVVLCQLGLQFFPDRPLALREMHRVLIPGGRLALNVFGPLARNPAPHALIAAVDRHLGPGASTTKHTEHALADPEAVAGLLADAGFRGIAIETATKMVRFPSPADYVQIQLTATPLATLMGRYEAAERERLLAAVSAEVSGALAPYTGGGGLAVPQEVHVVLARS
jgi:ubiquinone/menaquinone biosynthesis C-methylase UbiE